MEDGIKTHNPWKMVLSVTLPYLLPDSYPHIIISSCVLLADIKSTRINYLQKWKPVVKLKMKGNGYKKNDKTNAKRIKAEHGNGKRKKNRGRRRTHLPRTNLGPLNGPEEDIRLDDQLFYDDTSSDDDYFKDIDYVEASPPDYELVSLAEVKDFDTEDGEIDIDILLTIKDDILREKLRNINLLIVKVESLNDNPTHDFMLKSSSSFPIPVKDSDFFLEKSKTFLSLPKLETFRFDIEEKNSGSTTVHADISLPEYDSFHFEDEPTREKLLEVVGGRYF
ncbi:hypothetical protein Tco_1473941 [Tanacetum coccineum]